MSLFKSSEVIKTYNNSTYRYHYEVFTDENIYKKLIHHSDYSYSCQQTHQDIIFTITSETSNHFCAPVADGLFIRWETIEQFFTRPNQSLVLTIRTADCLSFMISHDGGIALTHAGWRGLHKGIHQSDILFPQDQSKFLYILGPHISQKNYQVGLEFKNYFSKDAFEIYDNHQKELYFSLPKQLFIDWQIIQKKRDIQLTPLEWFSLLEKENPLTYGQERYDLSPCTYKNAELHSYRRDQNVQRNYHCVIIQN